ncbi:MAG: hypothetical protein EA347_12030 [Thioalkalivibrio sp.]|nr:MAG: hypothetical protein EA347_12030 [Thioalkalivibrio sp.]
MSHHPDRSRYRAALTLVAVLMVLVLLWFAGSHWLVNSAWLPQRLSQLEGIEISWAKGRSRHPGRWEVEGFYLAREDDELALSVGAEHATLDLSVPALLWGELRIRSLDAHGIRRLTLNDLALEGDGRLRLHDTVFASRELEIARLDLQLDQGVLARMTDNATLVRDIALTAEASLSRIAPAEAGADLLGALSGTLQLDAHADAWDVFTPYLEPLPWLALAGRGSLRGDLALERGILAPGSTLRLDSPALRVEIDEDRLRGDTRPVRDLTTPDQDPARHRAEGDGSVLLAVSPEAPEQLTLTTRLSDVTLAAVDPYARQAALTLAVDLENRRLDRLEAPERARFALHGEVVRLDMLDPYLAHLLDGRGIRLRGAGELALEAEILGPRPVRARLEVTAPGLGVEALDYAASGGGTLHARLDDGDRVEVDVRLAEATLHHQARPLLTDAALQLTASGPFDPTRPLDGTRGEIAWQAARLPDIATLQPYLEPFLADPTPFELLGGSARSHGQLEVAGGLLRGALSLSGDRLRTRFREHAVESDIQLTLTLNEAALDRTRLDISGSRLNWRARGETPAAERLESELVLREGLLHRRNGIPGGRLALEGRIRQLGFLNAFLPDAHGLALQGDGQLHLEGGFEGNRILPGSHLQIAAEQLRVGFLDHRAAGSGELSARLETPEEARLSLEIPRYTLQREEDDRPHLYGRDLVLTTRTDAFSRVLTAPDPAHFTTEIALPETEIPDFARYNAYLPEDAGVRLLGGTARLASAFTLAGLDASGTLDLYAAGVDLALLDQRLRGDLHLALRLTEGDLATRQFSAARSFLRLDRVQRQNGARPEDAGWWVHLDFQDARLRWTEQVHLSSRLHLRMRDTGLLARLFLDRARDSDWLGRLLDVRGIAGSAWLDLNETRIRLSAVDLRGENLIMLADLALAEGTSNGALYARLGVLGVGVELDNGEPTLRIVRPRRWFDAWRARNAYRP